MSQGWEDLFEGRAVDPRGPQTWKRSPDGQDLAGKVAWVTGAAHGQGRATSLLLAERGAAVVLADVDGVAAHQVEQECIDRGARTLTLQLDQSDSAQVDAALSAAVDHFGRIDMQVNVAAAFLFTRVVDMTDEQWNRILQVDLTGVFYLCRAAARLMVQQGSGAIVNVSSSSADFPTAGTAAYAASKAGLAALSRVLALECAPHVRVNVVCPGPVRTQARPDRYPADNDNSLLTVVKGGAPASPLMRWADPEELAEVFIFLLSDRASFVNGQVLHVNGGLYMA